MRKYREDGTIEALFCNRCGKKLKMQNGIVQEGVLRIAYPWDYFSKKDGEIHRFDLCEDCYDAMTKQFKYAPETEHATEFV